MDQSVHDFISSIKPVPKGHDDTSSEDDIPAVQDNLSEDFA